MTENYLSGKKRSLKLGVSGHSENLTSLQTVGGVGIGTTNADKRALYVVGNTEIVGVLTAASYSGDGSGLTGVAATDHVASFDLQVAGISTFYDDVRVVRGGIDVSAGVVSATQFDVGTGGLDVDGQTDLDELVVAGVSTFSKAIDLNAGIDVDGQADLDEVVVAGVSTFSGISTHIGTLHAKTLKVAGVSTFSNAVTMSAASSALTVNSLTTNKALEIQFSGTTKGQFTPESGGLAIEATGSNDIILKPNQAGGTAGDILLKS